MAKTIDERIVELDFNNKDFEQGVKETMGSIDKLNKGLQFKGATKGLEQIDKRASTVNFSSMSSAIDGIANRFSTMGIIGMTIIQNLTNSVLQFGRNVANTLVVDPVKMGFSEYETKINAIQTILANTSKEGVTLERVTEVLDELNTYADQTIYNFTEMTKNIGTFTAAGIDLDTSAAAIKGIANLAAVSGSNSQQASTAMYQLSQALSSGTLKLQDWNSVVNAGMGGMVFQEALKETARVHGVNVDKMIEQNGSFRESLKEGWITKDILTETLAKFTGDLTEAQLVAMGYAENQVEEILKLGEVANDAATKVKTLTQLGDTLKEAMQSGWTQSWELIIGDFEQAKAALTGISDYLGGMINDAASARNAILQGWQDLGGRENLFNSFFQTIEAIERIIKPFKAAMAEIFPPVTAEKLHALTWGLEVLTGNLQISQETAEKFKMAFKAFFAAIDIGIRFVVSFAKALWTFLQSFEGGGEKMWNVVRSVSEFIINLREAIIEGKSFDKLFDNMFTGLRTFISDAAKATREFIQALKDSETLQTLWSVLKVVAGGLAYAVKILWDAFKGREKIDWGPLKEFFKELSAGLKLSEKAENFFDGLMKSLRNFGEKMGPKAKEVVKHIGEVRGAIVEWLKEKLSNLDANKVLDTVNKGLLGGLLLGLKSFVKDGQSILGGGLFVVFLKEVTSFVSNAGSVFSNVNGILDGVKDSLKAYQNQLKSKMLLRIAAAIAILALAIIALTFIDPEKLTLATVAIAAMFAALIATMDTMGAITKDNPKKLGVLSAALVVISVAILVLAGAIRVLSKLDPEQVAQGTAAIIALLVALGVFLKAHSYSKGIAKTAVGMVILAAAMSIFARVIEKLGKLKTDVVAQGLQTLGLGLAMITAASRLIPKDLGLKAVSILIMAGALDILTGVMSKFGEAGMDKNKDALLTIGVLLGLLAAGLNLMNGTLGGAAAMIVAAGAITILAFAMQMLGNLGLEKIGVSLLAIAGFFLVIGAAGALLTPVVPTLLGLGAALLLLGLGAGALGAGVAAFASGMAVLAVSGTAGAMALAGIILTLTAILPQVAKSIALAIVSLMETLAENAPKFYAALIKFLLAGLASFTTMIPEVVKLVMVLISTLLETIADNLPDIIQSGFDILIAFIQGIADNVGEVASASADLVSEFLKAIGEETPDIIDAGWEMVISLIDGIADSAEKNIPRMMESVRNLGKAIVTGIINGITQDEGSLFNVIWNIGSGLLTSFRESLAIRSPSRKFFDQARYILDGLVLGIRKHSGKALRAGSNFANDFVDVFQLITDQLNTSIQRDMDATPVITPILELSEFQKGINFMGEDLSDISGFETTVLAAGGIAGSLGAQQREALHAMRTRTEEDLNPPVQFIQNNYSPKPISPIDVYRNTKNLLKTRQGI